MRADLLLKYCLDLMRKNSDALGFVESTRFESRLRAGQVIPAWENGDLCGYLLRGIPREWLHIHQACIQPDARRLDHGRQLVAAAAAYAAACGCHGISLRCADDLPSNQFWQALGFSRVATVPGGRARGRLIHVYQYELPSAFHLFGGAQPAQPAKGTLLWHPMSRSE